VGVEELPRQVDTFGHAAKRDETLAGQVAPKGEAGRTGEVTPKRRSGHERMNPFRKRRGTVGSRKRCPDTETERGHAPRVTQQPVGRVGT
jgi:hypothetical protein